MKISFSLWYFTVISFVLAKTKSGTMYWKTFNERFPRGVKDSTLPDDGKQLFESGKTNSLIKHPPSDSLVYAERFSKVFMIEQTGYVKSFLYSESFPERGPDTVFDGIKWTAWA